MSVASNKEVLVIGAGIAGLTAAYELTQLGINVVIVEKGPFIGGRSANIPCQAADKCMKCNNCLVEARLREVSEQGRFSIRLKTEVEHIEKKSDRFHAALRSGPKFIDPAKCTDCGLCYDSCPERAQGAILMAPSAHIHPFFAIDHLKCSYFQGNEKAMCQAICPEGAIKLNEREEFWKLEVDGVVLATGYQPFDPRKNNRFNFDRFPNMVTGMDMEKMLRLEGNVFRPSDGFFPESLAFIQCVGSRDGHLNNNYCSRVCCGYAIRMALRVLKEHPEIGITVFYMDTQNFGKDFERYYEGAKDKIRFIRGLPGDFYASDDDRISISYFDEKAQKQVSEDFDMVTLSVGMKPPATNPFFKEILGLSLNEDGFLSLPAGIWNEGVVIAGSAEGPMDVSESISHAKRSALEMAKYLSLKS